MDRLVEHVVAWHNSHPLAKKITIYDVHTIGVVALPFVRTGRAGTAVGHGGRAGSLAEPIEPVLAEEGVGEAAAHDVGESTLDAHANTTAQHLDALADGEDPAEHLPKPSWRERLSGLAGFWKRGAAGGASSAWPAFSERFIPGLRPARVAKFAQAQGFLNPPGDASWPQRVVAMDEAMMAKHSGAWPFELYLISAAIDAGNSRSRVLIGVGRKPHILGPRCWSPKRLGLAAMVLLGLLGLGSALLLQKHHAAQEAVAAAEAAASAASAAQAASAASAAALVAAQAEAASAAAAAAAASAAAEGASAPASEAAGSEAAASGSLSDSLPQKPAGAQAAMPPGTAASPAAEAASEPQPDIRPNFVKALPKRTPFGAKPEEALKPEAKEEAPKPAAKPGEKTSDKAASDKTATTAPLVEKLGPLGTKGEDKTIHSVVKPEGGKSGKQDSKPVVALVGPVSPSKQEAEAQLARMRGMIAPMHAGALQAQVFQTPEGWRPAVWPFDGREEAQLINATLVARGMRTKAVDF
ncbi:hypothetical protein DBR47_15125 [Paucibacter sp. KBW04]|uniref:hypothetical protein n=1 Tax=Paucibacter sp. KBW04 TaxID=2153361 RepID=UPI000F578DD8|nr:hypothetical protein [Paucibacter sp. KBW04]RQO57172.1 hypothetical protein DBR47_15125 [Paucibacter sp. KBW04]